MKGVDRLDKISKEKRSENMKKIKSKNTEPELLARKALWKMGYRYRLHYKELPGNPDIVLTKQKTAIFVHGCFWHRHEGCINASRPKSNSEYWENKIKSNLDRDKRNQSLLREMGWRVLVVWECQLKKDIDFNISFLERLLNE
ncbi:very short patch repair endonuclease [Flexistipes sp.]|uniref:very short patch repair endonuclease n=1 Tax=Flexistipes sp. TaxID=3088135 RepID=UPI002E24E0F6|nr:very short patch repair endonuclease [Flexistipes sp.]